jgi:hypothetical protein
MPSDSHGNSPPLVVKAHRVRVLPAAAQAVVVLAEHASGEILLFGIQPRASGEKARGLAGVLGGGVNPARASISAATSARAVFGLRSTQSLRVPRIFSG